MFSVPPNTAKTSTKFVRILEQVKTLDLRLRFSLISSGILPNVCLGFYQAMKARKFLSISFLKYYYCKST